MNFWSRSSLGMTLFLLMSLNVSCADQDGFLDRFIEKHGYISYKTPLEQAGTGTLVGGTPEALSLIAHPETCFPSDFEGEKTLLRHKDVSTLPSTEQNFNISGGVGLLLKPLSAGNSSIYGGVRASQIKRVSIALKGVHIEYIDSIALSNFYRTKMSPLCKDYLDRVGFIVQAVRIDQMKMQFYSQNNSKIELDADVVKGLLTVPPDLSWTIESTSTLSIDTPKYIGYQLASLRREDEGLVLRRAKRTYYNQFLFETLNINKPMIHPEGVPYSGPWSNSIKTEDSGFKMPLDQVDSELVPFNFDIDLDDYILNGIK